MDLKLLLSPVQKDSESDSTSTQNKHRDEYAADNRPTRSYHPQESQQQQEQYRHRHQQQHNQPRETYPQHGQQQYGQQQPYYPLQDPYQPQPSENTSITRPYYYGAQQDHPSHYDRRQDSQQGRGSPYGASHERTPSHPQEHPQHYSGRSFGAATPPQALPPALVPPILSISASTPLAGESPQPPQYFVPTHRPAPPAPLPPPTGLNLSSYSFLLMEKRDREREAMERANRGYLMGEVSSGKNESAPPSSSPASYSATQHPPRSSSPRIDDARRAGHPSLQGPHGQHGYGHGPTAPQHTTDTRSYAQYPQHEQSGQYGYPPPHEYDAPSQYNSHGPDYQHYPSYGAAYPQPPPPLHGYSHQSYQHNPPPPHPHHHYHSSGSTNIGQESYYRSQDYGTEPHNAGPYSHQSLHHQQQHLHNRAMSPSVLDKPRFANANLSVFRQTTAEDSDGNASVSSSGSHKRRRRPNKASGGKKSLLPGSALGTSHGGMSHYLIGGSSSHGSAEGQEDFYEDENDEDSSDEQLDVRNGIQKLNLQKSIKSSVSDRVKKSRTKTERPFKIGELVESMKSDTDGTWFAGRVLDLEDDPHDHINPKSVLIHFEGFSPHHDEWVKPIQLRACSTGSSFLRYGPDGQEPPENWEAYEKFYHSELGRTARRHTGLAYDRRMLLHKCQCNTNPEERHHPEQPERLVEILCQFQKNGMLSLVKWIQGREATIEELVAAHADTHVRNYCCTAAQNRQYALEHGLVDTDLQIEDDVEEEIEEEPEEENEDENDEAAIKPGRRNRPRRSTRGSILVPTAGTNATDPTATLTSESAQPPVGTIGSEDVDMIQSTSPTDISKDGVEVDLHSPALGRRRSSMRGSAIRMSSLVSMSSTLYAQQEEDMVPEEVKAVAAALAREEEEEDDDDKMGQAGPAPSEAALAVAGGMDPSLANQLTSSPSIPKLELQQDKVSDTEPSAEDTAESMKTEATTTMTPVTFEGMQSATVPEKSKLEAGISQANVIDSERRSSRSTQGQTLVSVAEPQAEEAKTENSVQDPKIAEDVEMTSKGKDKDKKAADKADKSSKDAVANKVSIRKKGQTVSPAPMPKNDSVIIRPPGLTFTMSCGQLGIAVDTTWNPYHSSTAAKVAAGSLITLVDQVVTGRCKNGFAIIRPPGHHAEEDEAMGFCFFNNVGVAVNLTLSKYPLTVQKILIIDWDVHHGNGTQQIFYENPNVLYISLHRWDNGHFYPFTGAPDECGEEAGEGKNVNIAWSSYGRGQAMGDVEYIAAFWYVLLPIARQFQPDLVMVSAGFDAADGHAANILTCWYGQIGGYTVSPQGFAILTRLVQTLAGGRVILSLEGGYEFEPLAMSATACLEELLPHSLLPATAPTRAFPYASFQGTLNSVKPNAMAVSSLHQVLKYQQKYWKFPAEVLSPSFRFQLPAEWKASNSLATRPRRERNTRRKAPALDS
ncbi:Histone deacetylase 4 [Haplosporangium sp. Z 767]|nr:Histone deacetylase 4 [Haplosporangium sp. Z 767]